MALNLRTGGSKSAGIISTALGAVTSAIDSANQKAEEARQKAKESADTANTLGDEIADLASKYITLSEAVKTDASAKEELISTQAELLDKLGLEGESIDDLIAKYGSLSNAIRQASIDSLKNKQIDLIAGVDATREELLKVGADGFWGGNNIINATGDDAVKAFKELEKAGVVDSGSFGSGGGALVLIGDDTTTEGILENYERLENALETLRDSNAFTAEELSDNSLYQAIYGRYTEMKDKVEAYNSSIDNLNENLAQQTMLTALQGSELPKSAEDFEIFKEELINTAIASKQFIGSEKEITDAINNYLSTVPEFEGFYSIPLENELDKVDALLSQERVSNISIPDTINQLNTQLKPAIDSLAEAYNDIFTSDGFTRENIGLDMFSSIQSEIDELNKIEGINIDYSSFKNLVSVLNDTKSSTAQIKDAFDQVAYSISNAAISGVEDFEVLKESLRQLGYVEYELTAFDALIKNTEVLEELGFDLATATNEQIIAFAKEMISTENLAEAINMLTYQKILNGLADMDTSTEVANLKTLAENAGITGEVIQYLTELEQIYQEVSTGVIDPLVLNEKIKRANELKSLIEASASKISFAPKENSIDWKPLEKSASSAGKSAAEEYKEALEDKLSDLGDVINHINDIIGDQIDLFEEQKDKAVDALEAQKEAAEEALEAQKELIQSQIDAKQAEIDKIKEAREERKTELDLQKKQYEFELMQNQKTSLIYKNSQMVYDTDEMSIRDAREAVIEAQENIKIANIEKEIRGLEDVLDSLDTKIETSNDYYDSLIESTEKYWDNLIQNLENYNNRWKELANIEEQAKANMMLENLGITADEILNMSDATFQSFKQSYLDVLTEMYSGNTQMINSLNEIANGADFSPLNENLVLTKQNIEGLQGTDLSDLNTSVGEVNDSFGVTSEAVQDVTNKLVGGEDTEETTSNAPQEQTDSSNLRGAIQAQSDTASEVIPQEIELFANLQSSIASCVAELNNMAKAMQAVANASANVSSSNAGLSLSLPSHAEGTVGKAFASGTSKYNGLPHDEKLAVRSEYGQPETTIYPDGTVELTTEPTASPLPKGTVILNEEQTNKMLNNKGTVLGTALAKGTNSFVRDDVVLKKPDYTLSDFRPLQEGDKGYDLMKKFQAYQDKLSSQIVTPVNAIQRDMELVSKNISNVNTNNRTQTVNFGDINVTCPGVNSKEVMNQVKTALRKELGGIALEALQEASITR